MIWPREIEANAGEIHPTCSEATSEPKVCSILGHSFWTSPFFRAMKTPTSGDDLLGRLPPELLPAIVEASSTPYRCYLQLLSLSHAIRVSIRGTPHELSVDYPPYQALDDFFTPTDALAAVVGSCKNLRKLSFPEMWRDTAPHATKAGWVDEAFGGHPQLAVLEQLPPLPEPDIECILSHLPGLVELTVNLEFQMSTGLLGVLARSCPGLQVLRCTISCDYPPLDHLTALAPLSGVLKELDFDRWIPDERLPAFLGSLSAVTSLKLLSCPPAALEPIAPHLTTLVLYDTLHKEEDLPGPWLCRLETLYLNLYNSSIPAPSLARLLAANQATLRSLTLRRSDLGAPDDPSLAAALRALPHLTQLCLSGDVVPDWSFSALLPPDLVDRLEYLYLEFGSLLDPSDPVRIVSSRLRQLHIAMAAELALDCPALVELRLIGVRSRLASMQCPRLRILNVPAAQRLTTVVPMPDLVVASFWCNYLMVPAWLLAGSPPPRLRVLSGVRLTDPELLARLLCTCGSSLVRLEQLHLDVTRFPNPLVLRLPGQLERLDLRLVRSARPDKNGPPLDLQLEAPGLLSLSIVTPDIYNLPSVRVQRPNCPRLVHLALKSPVAALSLQLDEDGESAMRLRSLSVGGWIQMGCLLGLLARHGARLSKVTSRVMASGKDDWPQLMEALSGLPRLTSLTMDVSGASSPRLSFAFSQLRTLDLHKLPKEAKVVLACPQLEKLEGLRDPSRQLELALPAPNLCPPRMTAIDDE
ncbi:hypothetical protein PAPYR_584 [Paratrimastix pyriformis]|uniref:F-box domain-containing protein n=1 Tax=Paratrimastix pyriformis TaxID=342808 RepID=A0ABQ8UTZ2_9EUKA|nr:hypothetical protein PAPYR_584 [Paratrimastix pyriformis]